jgi:hypothetical protein
MNMAMSFGAGSRDTGRWSRKRFAADGPVPVHGGQAWMLVVMALISIGCDRPGR